MTSTVLHSFTELVVSPQKVVRLVRHNLHMVHPCWLFPVTFPSFVCLDMASRKTGSMIFLATEIKPIDLGIVP